MLPLALLVAAKCPSPSPLLRTANSTCYSVHQILNTKPQMKNLFNMQFLAFIRQNVHI